MVRKNLFALVLGISILTVVAIIVSQEEHCESKEGGCLAEQDDDSSSALMQLRSIKRELQRQLGLNQQAGSSDPRDGATTKDEKKVKAFYEMCKAEAPSRKKTFSVLQERKKSAASSKLSEDVGCDLNVDQVIEEDTPEGVSYSCCPLSQRSCSGCAKNMNDYCITCTPGYFMINGQCTACVDTTGWTNADGLTCWDAPCSDVKVRGISSNEACCRCSGGHHAATPFAYRAEVALLGSDTVAGGPVPRTADRYSLDEECELIQKGITINGETGQLMLSEDVESSTGCASLGTEVFEVTCTITAHQTNLLNYSATLTVKADWFAYRSFNNYAVVLPPKGTAQNVGASKDPRLILSSSALLEEEEDADAASVGNVARHNHSDDADRKRPRRSSSPRSAPSASVPKPKAKPTPAPAPTPTPVPSVPVSLWLENNDYMCYANPPTRIWCWYEMYCAATQTGWWLIVDEYGYLTAEAEAPPPGAPGITGIDTWNDQVGAPGGTCQVTVHHKAGGFPWVIPGSGRVKTIKFNFPVARPVAWPTFSYDTPSLISTIGELLPILYVNSPTPPEQAASFKMGAPPHPQYANLGSSEASTGTGANFASQHQKSAQSLLQSLSGAPVPESYANPSRFSMSCDEFPYQSSGMLAFAFDSTTGVGTLNGLPYLTLDITTGAVHVDATASLITVLDGLDTTDIRRHLTLSCAVIAHFDFFVGAQNPSTYTNLNITLQDDTCWLPMTGLFLKPTAAYPDEIVSASSESACRTACRLSPTCTHYSWENATCEFVHYRCQDTASLSTCREVTAMEKVSNCGEEKSCIRLNFAGHWGLSGYYCPKALNAFTGWVYEREAVTPEDVLWLAPYDANHDASTGCSPGQWLLRKPDSKDYLSKTDFIAEFNGVVRLCLDASGDITELALTDGTVNLTVAAAPNPGVTPVPTAGTAAIENPTCGLPNITDLNDEVEAEAPTEDEGAIYVEPIVLDDPTTSIPDDHWLHPCSCFSETNWGQFNPVDLNSFQDVPAGSSNQYHPAPFEIVNGEYTCQPGSDSLISIIIYTEEETAAEDFEVMCQQSCRGNGDCLYFFEGTAGNTKQCRLYKKCTVLVREVGIVGSLKGLPMRHDQVCRVANPDLCSQVSNRRAYLSAPVSATDLNPSPSSECLYESLLQQCDFKMLLDQLGINACGKCSYSFQAPAFWQGKTPPPEGRASGYQLEGRCWEERYTAVPLSGTGPSSLTSTKQLLTCASGQWISPDGGQGLTNFACATCITVGKSPYRNYLSQNREELYFTPRQELYLYVMSNPPMRLAANGSLVDTPLELVTESSPTRVTPPDYIYGTLSNQYVEDNVAVDYCVGIETGRIVDIASSSMLVTVAATPTDGSTIGTVTWDAEVSAYGAWSSSVTNSRTFEMVDTENAAYLKDGLTAATTTAGLSDSGDYQAIPAGIATANVVGMPHIDLGGRYAGEVVVQIVSVLINGTEEFYPSSTSTLTLSDIAFGYDSFPVSTTMDIQVDNQNMSNPLSTWVTITVQVDYTYSTTTANVASFVDCTSSNALSLAWYDGTPDSPGPALIIESGTYAGKCLSQTTSSYRGSPMVVPTTCDPASIDQMWEYQTTFTDALRLSASPSGYGCLSTEVERSGDAVLRVEPCQSTGTGSLTRGNWNYDYSQEEFTMSNQDCFATVTPTSACPVSCGGGYQTRTITVLSEPRGVGQACPLVIVECGMTPCPNGNSDGWLAQDFVDAGVGVKMFRSTSNSANCLQFNASGSSQFSSAACDSTVAAQQIDSAQVPAMLWDLVRKQAANGQLITQTTLSAKFGIPSQPRYLADITLDADCGEDAVVQELRWGTTTGAPGLQVRCSAAVINSNYREATTEDFPRGDFIRAKEGGYCATVSTSNLPGSGATDAEKKLAAQDKLAWLQLLKCDPDNVDQMFYWVGKQIKSQSTGLCFFSNSTSGYFHLRECSYNIQWKYDKRGRLKASPETSASGWGKTCLSWMKSKKGTETATRVGVNIECLDTSSDAVNVKNGQVDPSQQQWEVGPGIIGLKDGYVDCASGFALNTFEVTATELKYSCAPLGAVGSCMEKVTAEVDTVSYDLVQMPRLDMNCTRGAITKISPELASGGDSFKYRYTCCDLTEPAAIVLTGIDVTDDIPTYSGVYCSPENRDASGRLIYEQRSWYNTEVTPSNSSFYFDDDQGAWCLSNSTCESSDVAVPTDAELETTEWQAMPVLNFAYSPNPRGVTQPMPKKREFPELIEFKAATPEYARECQNDVTPGQSGFDRDLMNKVFVELPKQNPCSLVGGVSKQDSTNGQATGFSYRVSKNPYELNGDTEYGLTYSDVFDCSTRAINRAGTVFHTDLGFEAATMGREAIEQTQNIVCPVIPDVGLWAGFMGGTETEWKTSKICSSAYSWAFFVWKNLQNAAHMIIRDIAEDNERNDCDPLQSGMARIFCDLHCIRDAVVEGDSAILTSMEKAAQVQTENNKLLMEYYSGLVLDKLDVMSGTTAGLLQEEVRTDVEEARKLSDVLFQEMHSLVASTNLDPSGSASLSRELDRFLAEEEHGLTERLSANKTLLIGTPTGELKESLKSELALLSEKAQRLHTVATGAASQGLSQKVEVDRRVHDFVIQHQELLTKYNAKLGEFQARSEYTSRVQQSLMQAAQPTLADLAVQAETNSVEELMMNLDSTWWELRGTFDSALEAVSDHMNSMQHTTGLLKDYTSMCQLEYPELLNSFHSTMDVADKSKAKLQETWHQAVFQLGLLTSKIVDGNAFTHFARADMLAVNIDEVLSGKSVNATLPMTKEGLSLLSRQSLCAKEVSKEAMEAASLALHNAAFGSAGRGLWMQTIQQVAIVLAEMRGMRHWHGPLGLGPAPHVKQADLSAERLRSSVESSLKVRDLLIQDAVLGFQKRQCQ